MTVILRAEVPMAVEAAGLSERVELREAYETLRRGGA
jgi:hypothetical protein